MCCIEWWHCRWPQVTPNHPKPPHFLHFFVAVSFGHWPCVVHVPQSPIFRCHISGSHIFCCTSFLLPFFRCFFQLLFLLYRCLFLLWIGTNITQNSILMIFGIVCCVIDTAVTARIVAYMPSSVKRSYVRPSVRPSVSPIIQQQRRVAGLVLSAVRARYRSTAPGARDSARRSAENANCVMLCYLWPFNW